MGGAVLSIMTVLYCHVLADRDNAVEHGGSQWQQGQRILGAAYLRSSTAILTLQLSSLADKGALGAALVGVPPASP